MRGQVLISFVNSLINKEKKGLVSQEDVLSVMSICLAAEQAVNSKNTVTIKYL